jgi:hypothetical protein
MINFHLYDPVRQGDYEYVHLGNLGSAHRQIVYQPSFHKGFDAGFHNYDLYLTRPEDIPYYSLEKAYSDIYFSQTNQEKTAFNARFSKPLMKKTYLGIHYKNIRNKGQYTNQAARTNAFTVNANFQSKNQKYRGYLSFTTNTVEQRENGGGVVTDSTNFRKGILPVGRTVHTSSGKSRYFQGDLNYTQFYLLQKTPKRTELPVNPADSLVRRRPIMPSQEQVQGPPNKPSKESKIPAKRPARQLGPPTQAAPTPELPVAGRKFTLKHNLVLRRNTYKYVDQSSLNYYGNFSLDDRGVRHFIRTGQIENTFSIRTYRLDENKSVFTSHASKNKTIKQKDLIELGATHLYTDLYQEPFDSTIHNLFLFGKMHFTPSDRLKIKTYGHLGMFKQIGDYFLKGDFLWDTKKLGRINFSIQNQLYSPSLANRRMIITHNTIWQNDFKKVFETNLSVNYYLEKLKIDLTGNYHLIDNFIYYNTEAKPAQATTGINIFQLKLSNQIDVGPLHLQNTVYFQKATQDIIRFPSIYSIHRLYLDLKLFKVMITQVGADLRYNTSYKPDNFQPLTAQFFQQNDHEVGFYPTIDAFINFRIQQFRFFFIYENLYDFVEKKFNYHTYPYPQFDPQARFGFRWLFLD